MIKARAALAVLADFKGLNDRKLSLGSVHPHQKSLGIHSRHIHRHTARALGLIMDQNGYPLDARCTCDPKYRARFQSREEPFSWARVQVLRWGSVMRLGENRPVELYVRQGDTHFDQFITSISNSTTPIIQ